MGEGSGGVQETAEPKDALVRKSETRYKRKWSGWGSSGGTPPVSLRGAEVWGYETASRPVRLTTGELTRSSETKGE